MLPPVLILAGGLGTRIQSIAHDLPKYMVPVNNEPFALHQLRLLKKAGFQKIILCVGYRADSIVSLLGDGQKLGLEIQYTFDGDELLGTGGAIQKVSRCISSSFCVLYGDSYLDIDFKPVHQQFLDAKKSGLMAVFRNENRYEKSNILIRNDHIVEYNKINSTSEMQYIDFGFSIFSADVFSNFKTTPFDLSVVIQHLIKKEELIAYQVSQRYYEIGTPAGLRELELFLSNRDA